MRIRSALVALFALAFAGTPAEAGSPPSVHVGDTAPLFLLPAINPEPALRMVSRTSVSLSDLTGVNPTFPANLVIVHFCDKTGGAVDFPVLDRVAKKYGNKGVRVLAVVSDGSDVAVVSSWVEGMHLSFPALQDRFGVVTGRWGVTSFPLTAVITPDGRIDALGVPGANMEGELEALVSARLG